MPRLTWPLLLLLAPALSAQAAAQAETAGAIDAPALFAANCAKCHGLDGSGTGPTVLDRPARNFKEGGFSFGNTAETIERTIAFGIPGSPMPAFEAGLSEAQRRALAEYVVTLGPPVKEVTEAETLLHVTDRPLIVRGILPALTEGGPMIPRGLLIGTPDGLTFQYAADDVRLLAVRQGDFVKRTDWGGRGGTPLEPLGKVVWQASDAAGRWVADQPGVGEALEARLLSTGDTAKGTLSYALLPPQASAGPHRAKAHVVETVERYEGGPPMFPTWDTARGFVQHFRLSPVGANSNNSSIIALDLGSGFVSLGDDTAATLSTPEGPRSYAWLTRRGGTAPVENRLIAAPLRADGTPAITIENNERGLFVRVVLDQPSTTFTVNTFIDEGSTSASLPPQDGVR